jgi:hypothetical protein
MFCPKCSEAQVSEDVRFCKRCGFRLEAVQDLIASEAVSKSRADSLLPKQKDISIGASLMFIGSVVAMFWAQAHLGADGDVLPQVFLILGFTLGFILLLFPALLGVLKKLFSDTEDQSGGRDERKRTARSRKQRDGINLGALLMFLGTVKALVLSTFEHNPPKRAALALAITTGIFLMLLFSRWLVEGVYRLFFNSGEDGKVKSERVTAELPPAIKEGSRTALPPTQNDGIPIEVFKSKTSEMTQPASVTENTTGLLSKP